MRRGCASVEQLKATIASEKLDNSDVFAYPRWVRINNLRTTLDDQFHTTFSAYQQVDTLNELVPGRKVLYVDPHIPDLLAVPHGVDFTSSAAYKRGEIILQDKASCFPAYLLLGRLHETWVGDLVDGCAAPGNKTTHLASLLEKQKKQTLEVNRAKNQIFSMDASRTRSKTLQKMVSLAGADATVTVLPAQDFLALDPTDSRFKNVTGLLLDPSCSGSGIIGRDDVPQLTLPRPISTRKKRKRGNDQVRPATTDEATTSPSAENHIPTCAVNHERLRKLSNLQARIVEHAFCFPSATHVTYSTCSVHLIENEGVVARLLASEVARRRGWRLLRRDEQPPGLHKWKYRGIRRDRTTETISDPDINAAVDSLPDETMEACLRCWPGDAEGLGGFFVAGFVRDPSIAAETPSRLDVVDLDDISATGEVEDEEWKGFSD